ncbi:MAG: hydrolase, partial [Saprospiraceae bacterium]|nr:hydrolase [Saprospiraceae bacterium]
MNIKPLYVALFLHFCAFSVSAANPDKKLNALRITEHIQIDGRLSEADWDNAEVATGFVQKEPNPGLAASFETKVYFLYDNNAIYIGARMFDPEPDKILKELSLRDMIGNADNFRIFLDT